VTFTIYEKHPTLDAYRYGPSFTPYAIVAVDKRFSDAELAAEYHSAWAVMLDVPKVERYGYEPTRIATLHRFATLPHTSDNNYE
jgi:hypothetical protein